MSPGRIKIQFDEVLIAIVRQLCWAKLSGYFFSARAIGPQLKCDSVLMTGQMGSLLSDYFINYLLGKKVGDIFSTFFCDPLWSLPETRE